MDEDGTTGNSPAAETFDPDLIHAIFKLVWRRRVGKGGGGNEDIDVERPRGEIGIQLPMQMLSKSAANFCEYLLQRLFNALLLSLKRRMVVSSNPPTWSFLHRLKKLLQMHFLEYFRDVMVFDITKHSPVVITAPGAQNPAEDSQLVSSVAEMMYLKLTSCRNFLIHKYPQIISLGNPQRILDGPFAACKYLAAPWVPLTSTVLCLLVSMQQISAPHMHATCLELLKDHLQPGMHALDVGSGSGYLTACFAMMVGPEGRAVGIEHIPEIVASSIENVQRSAAAPLLRDGSLSFHVTDGRLGFPDVAPYDAIHVAAAAPKIPQPLLDQLKPGGRMVIPVGTYLQDLQVVDKNTDGSISIQKDASVRYVPLTSRSAQLQDP
ncbi:unnamed protein product [Miscanthus lutarioriparius]|uniref:Protein-L-isoaspartate O-methyltransferase n=1 Tax=Miscanthus lutarioriparius TaxID=422564 RepID=A0A811QWA6_9POAL|nr:unnamed protein product [Miscanthus lutarioriparius]